MYAKAFVLVVDSLRAYFYASKYVGRQAFPGRHIRQNPDVGSICLFLFPSFSYTPRCCTAGEILIVAPIRRLPGSGQPRLHPVHFVCFIQSYSRFSLRAPVYFLLLASLSRPPAPHPRNLYFCYYWKSSLSGAR